MQPPARPLDSLKRPLPRRLLSLVFYGGGVTLAVFAVLVTALRFWILPNVGDYAADIAGLLSRSIGKEVRIAEISADWQGLHPRLEMGGLSLHDNTGRQVLGLNRVRTTLAWRSLLVGDLRLKRLEIIDPVLDIRREADGLIYVAGIPVNEPGEKGRFGNWILSQPLVLVLNATLRWDDRLRGAPTLEMRAADLQLTGSGDRHEFSLRAEPSGGLGRNLDVRGEFTGHDLSAPEAWRGTLYVRMDNTHLSAWRTWVILQEFSDYEGEGDLRLWLEFGNKAINRVSADLDFRKVSARLFEDMPALEASRLSGQAGWRRLKDGNEYFVNRLVFQPVGGALSTPADFRLRLNKGGRGGGQLLAIGLRLEAFGALVGAVPLPKGLRPTLEALAPRGRLDQVAASWEGDWRKPANYALEGRFQDLALQPIADKPGFRNLSGRVTAKPDNGSLTLHGRDFTLDYPAALREPLQLDTLDAGLSWRAVGKNGYDITIDTVSLANADLAGTLAGRYRVAPDEGDSIDLEGKLTRGAGTAAWRYLPWRVNEDTVNWLRQAIISGRTDEVTLRLRGRVAEFPFAKGNGEFRVAAKIRDGVLKFAPDWPEIRDLDGDLTFQGEGMQAQTRSATILGVNLHGVRAVISDLFHHDETLRVDGKASGGTERFLEFIRQSPVKEHVGGFIHSDTHANGTGHLSLLLTMPLKHVRDSRVSGAYRFIDNVVRFAGIPELSAVSGNLMFTEEGVNARDISARILGGPVAISVASRGDGRVRLDARGTLEAADLGDMIPAWLGRRLTGTTDWEGRGEVRPGEDEFFLDTDLKGLRVDLPAPFGKAADKRLALHFAINRRDDEESLTLAYGNLASAAFLIDRHGSMGSANVRLGPGQAGAPNKRGLWISGLQRSGRLEDWDFLFESGEAEAEGEAGAPLTLNGLNLTFNEFAARGRRFHDINIQAAPHEEGWHLVLSGRELDGDLVYTPGSTATRDRGKVQARFKRLVIPEPEAELAAASTGKAGELLPYVDLVADEFGLEGRKLGGLALRLSGTPQGVSLERLELKMPATRLIATGSLARSTRRETWVDIDLQSSDTGKLLTRLGYPGTMKRGEMRIFGKIGWRGGPDDFQLANLGGRLSLSAAKGQFTKVEPGAGRLLGILSLQALPRRITLDFRDLFSEGFAFDTISSTMFLDRGVIYSNDFVMDGPAAKVSMGGQVDLNRETQTLRVKVSPKLNTSLALAGALAGGPVVGAGALVLQQVLKDQIGQATTFEYLVDGGWQEPVVKRLHVQPAEELEQ
jgi:uncharacterized protein (TIGR02099 family)